MDVLLAFEGRFFGYFTSFYFIMNFMNKLTLFDILFAFFDVFFFKLHFLLYKQFFPRHSCLLKFSCFFQH